MFEKCIQFDRMFVPAYVGLSKMHRGFLSGILLRRAVSFNDENGIVRLEYAEWLYNHSKFKARKYFISFIECLKLFKLNEQRTFFLHQTVAFQFNKTSSTNFNEIMFLCCVFPRLAQRSAETVFYRI